MEQDWKSKDYLQGLRARALDRLQGEGSVPSSSLDGPALRHGSALLHELNVQRIELELQNEELREAYAQLQASTDALRRSEGRYRDLFELSPSGYVRLDETGRVVEVNRRMTTLLGLGRDQVNGRRFTDFVSAHSQDSYHLHYQALLHGSVPGPVHVQLRCADGVLRDAELSGARVDGDSRGVHLAVLDVTDQQRAESQRFESERQRRLMADALPLAVCYLGVDGRVRFSNAAFRRLFESPYSAVEGRAVHDALSEAVYGSLRDQIRSALRGESTRFEGDLELPLERKRNMSVLFAPDRDPRDKSVHGLYMLFDDRTELEAVRSGLRRAAAQAALAEERERRALAADLHDDTGQILALASIKLAALQERVADDDVRAMVAELSELVGDARKSAMSLCFELTVPQHYGNDLPDTLEWVAETVAKRYGIRVDVERRGVVPRFDDATTVTLARALRELLINAAKHSGVRRASVTVRGDPSQVSVIVADAGIGFDPRGSTSGGIGLKLVIERIESLGGRVSIESSARQGTMASISVPAGKGGHA